MKKNNCLIFIIFASIFVLATWSPKEAAAEPIKIGIILGVTGPAAFVCEQANQGHVLAIEEINANGGILGRPLKANLQDSRCNPNEAINAFRNLTQQDYRLFLGAACSSATLAILPQLPDTKAVMVNSISTNPTITGQGNKWIFRVNPPDSAFAPVFGKLIVKELGDKKLSILAVNNDLGRGAAAEFSKAVKAAGGKIISEDFYPTDGPWEFSSVLTSIKGSDSEGIIFVGTSEPGLQFIRQHHEQGLNQTIYSRGISLSESLFAELGALADGIYSTEPYYAEIESPANKDFIQRFKKRWGEGPVYQAMTAYAATQVLAKAIESAGTDEASAVRSAMEKVTYQAVTGKIAFDGNNQAHLPVYVARVECTEKGQCKVVVVTSATF